LCGYGINCEPFSSKREFQKKSVKANKALTDFFCRRFNNSSALPGGVVGAGPAARLFLKTIFLPSRAGLLVLGLRPGLFPLRGGSRLKLASLV